MADAMVLEPQEADTDELTAALEGSSGAEIEDVKETEEGKTVVTEEEKKVEEDAAKPETEEEQPGELDVLKSEMNDLRQLLRTSKRELTQTQAKLERLNKRSVATEDKEEIDEDGKLVKVEKDPLSTIEELQQGIADIGKQRGASLDILFETMEQNNKYANIREVCSRNNFDDVFEAIATELVNDKGGDINEVLLEVELNVWSKTNPYSYMYNLITKYHPAYAETKVKAKPGDAEKKKKEPVKAPGSIAGLGGDSNIKGGWTAARIDKLPEDQLSTVPTDVYAKYMRNELT